MKFIQIGKTDESYLSEGIANYKSRMKHYQNIEEITINIPRKSLNQGVDMQKKAEGVELFKLLSENDYLILLDERGDQLTSIELAKKIERFNNNSLKSLVFCIGGAFGFSEEVYLRSNEKISFSKFTFSHQMIRLLFWEQVYRAHTIIKREKYHH
ncbi:MAG: 23S rRNA (pseudouridine(1915)-N(3))-methyltransferase RlmH [Bacteroidota bacterium]|jgi:23S rRNA (pseudouridine1915-N3)-methyltransferase